jgi:hypothetical protein
MLNGDPFAQFGASLRRLLTLAKFDEQGFIGMDADTTSFATGGALGFQGALSAGRLGKMDHATGHKGHLLSSRTLDGLPWPVQDKRLLVKVLAFANRPSFAIDLQLVAALSHPMTTQIGPINVQFLQGNSLLCQIGADGWGHTGFRGIGWGHSYGSDQAGVQIMKHVPLVSIHAHTATFASMAHLSIFDADASVLGDSFDEAGKARLIDLHILLFDAARAV